MITKYAIKKVYKQRNWWDLIINLKISTYLTYIIANNTRLTPNQITLISLILAFISGLFFYFNYYLLGAIIFQLSYIFDIVDGALARVTNKTSRIGAFFDVFTDWFKAPILIIIILYGVNNNIWIIIILFLFFLLCLINKYNDMLFYQGSESLSNLTDVSSSKIGKYFQFMKKINIQHFPSTIEVEALLLFFYPIFQNRVFIYLALVILLFQFFIKFYAILKKL